MPGRERVRVRNRTRRLSPSKTSMMAHRLDHNYIRHTGHNRQLGHIPRNIDLRAQYKTIAGLRNRWHHGFWSWETQPPFSIWLLLNPQPRCKGQLLQLRLHYQMFSRRRQFFHRHLISCASCQVMEWCRQQQIHCCRHHRQYYQQYIRCQWL